MKLFMPNIITEFSVLEQAFYSNQPHIQKSKKFNTASIQQPDGHGHPRQ
jgi:hypothetical protein